MPNLLNYIRPHILIPCMALLLLGMPSDVVAQSEVEDSEFEVPQSNRLPQDLNFDPDARFPAPQVSNPGSRLPDPTDEILIPQRNSPQRDPSQHAAGKTLYSFRASGLDLKSALALFARANRLNIVPDHDVTGAVTLDVQNLPLDIMMEAILAAHDCVWEESGQLIRVRTASTKTYSVDYLRLSRTGTGRSSAMLASASVNSGGGGGMAGGGGGGGGGAGGLGGDGSSVNLTQENPIDFWKELRIELERLLTPRGRESMAINMTAGLIQVTDRPSALARVESYLNNIATTVHRQVEIEARLYDVTLSDDFQFGIDWNRLITTSMRGGAAAGFGGTLPPLAGGIGSLEDRTAGFIFDDGNNRVVIEALQRQGEVNIISKPRIRTLNNQTALIKVGSERPFFARTSILFPNAAQGNVTATEQDIVTSITVGTILAITPQISTNDWITLDISPVLTSLVETILSPNGTTTAPVLDIKQASTIVRIRDGDTVVMGGLIQDQTSETRRKVPLLGDIPWVGKAFQGVVRSKNKKELVIFITPRIVDDEYPKTFPRLDDLPSTGGLPYRQ